MTDTSSTWPLQAARDQFSQLVKAAGQAPQTVTVHGKPAAIVLSPQAYARLKQPAGKSLSSEFLRPGLLDEDELTLLDRQADMDAHRDQAW